jgi:hypothetical protein
VDDKILTQKKSDTRIVDKSYVENWKGDLFCLIKDYFETSGDKAATPGSVLFDLMDHAGDPDYLVIVHEKDGIPQGFLIGKLVGNVARILLGFLGKGLDNKTAVREALELFDGWARGHRCVAADLYTHRHPKSYRSWAQYGWRHNYTVYRKELL